MHVRNPLHHNSNISNKLMSRNSLIRGKDESYKVSASKRGHTNGDSKYRCNGEIERERVISRSQDNVLSLEYI